MNVNYFLDIFGLRQESEQVTALVHSRATKIGSPAWVLAQFIHSKQLLDSGYIAEAIHLLETAFPHIDRAATYERAVAFGCLGQCYLAKGQPQQSIALQQEALAILRVLNQTYNVKLNIGIRQTGLADGLVELGQPEKARKTYKEALTIFQELKDLAGQASVLNQLGILAWRQLNTAEAIDCYTKSINLFQMDTPHVFNGKLALYQPMQEPIAKASILHNLGIIYQDQQRWDEAEHHFREAALIQESHGNLKSAIKSWNHLGIVSQFLGKTELANQWYKKVIEAEKQNGGNSLELALHLTNLAELLRHQPENLAEARDLAEKALFIKKSMDSGSVEIWKTYGLLAEIADVEANAAKDSGEQRKWRQTAINYRRLALDARRAFPGSRVILENCANLIILTVSVCGNFFTENRSLPWYHRLWRRPITVGDTHHIEAKARLKEWQAELRHESLYSAQLADALDRLLAGERDPNILCSDLHYDSALIMLTILNGLENPVSLEWLIPYLR
jgi:tetratricopeptide (TPR) repeat protein